MPGSAGWLEADRMTRISAFWLSWEASVGWLGSPKQ
jgi:hypothetical protein